MSLTRPSPLAKNRATDHALIAKARRHRLALERLEPTPEPGAIARKRESLHLIRRKRLRP